MKQLYIADDNKDFSDFMADVARLEGWSVKKCANGLELIETVASEEGAALLFVDVNMPEMDGIEVIKALVNVPRAMQLHFMTGGPSSTIDAAETIAKGHGLSVGGNIFKPISKQALISVLKQEALQMNV